MPSAAGMMPQRVSTHPWHCPASMAQPSLWLHRRLYGAFNDHPRVLVTPLFHLNILIIPEWLTELTEQSCVALSL